LSDELTGDCPYCGNCLADYETPIYKHVGGGAYVECPTCDMRTPWFSEMALAARYWNRMVKLLLHDSPSLPSDPKRVVLVFEGEELELGPVDTSDR
jgi:hypothetical protein